MSRQPKRVIYAVTGWLLATIRGIAENGLPPAERRENHDDYATVSIWIVEDCSPAHGQSVMPALPEFDTVLAGKSSKSNARLCVLPKEIAHFKTFINKWCCGTPVRPSKHHCAAIC
ncbi:hypothetical protein KCP74_15030 [Salmonella enterica subsp. enterica]|nr:hypothetical protein KCP74_15030 [Salmonella enterica subsp. enterica]